MENTEIDGMIQKHIVEVESVKYVEIPPLRFIGMDTITHGMGDQYGEMWGRASDIFPVLDQMTEYLTFIKDPCAFMHRFDTADEPMHYLVGRFMKADTPVPEGFDYFDIRECTACLISIRGAFDDMCCQYFDKLMETNRIHNRTFSFPVGAYIAEVYTKDSVPKPGVVSKMDILGFGVTEKS